MKYRSLISGGKISANSKKFKQKYTNSGTKFALGISTKDSATRVAALVIFIGNDAINISNTLSWEEEEQKKTAT